MRQSPCPFRLRHSHGVHWPGTITGTPLAFVWGRVQMVLARGSNGTLHRWWWQAGDSAVVQQADLGIPVATNTKLAGWTTSGSRKDSAGRDLLTATQHVVLVNPDGHIVQWTFAIDGDRPTSTDLTTASGVVATGGPAAGDPPDHWWSTPADQPRQDSWK